MSTAVATVIIAAPAHKVWEALTSPQLIERYFFGTEVISDWKIGGPISYRREVEGHQLEDRGMITKMVPDELLEITYWNSDFDLPDTSENYRKLKYRLVPEDFGTEVIVTEEDIPTEVAKHRLQDNWNLVLHNLKHLLEMR